MCDITCSAHISFPELTPEEIIKRAKQRPFEKFISFPINITIGQHVIEDEIVMEKNNDSRV